MAQNTVTTKLLLDSSQFQASMDKAAKKTQNFSQKMFRAGRDLTGALTLPLALIAKNVVETVSSFDLAQRKIAGLSGQSKIFESLAKSARELGASTIFTATEISELQLVLKKLGKNTQEIEGVQESILKFSQALDAGLAESGEFVVQTMNRFSSTLREVGDTTEQAAYVTDLFAAASANSAVDAEKLRNSLNYVGSEAAAAGFQLDETVALIGLLADRGFDASRGGTALRRILAELAKSGLTAQESIGALLSETSGYREELEKFGLRGGGPKAALAGLNTEFALLLDTLRNSEGFLDGVADVMDNSLFASLKKVQSAAKELSLSFGDDLQKPLQNFLAMITDVIRGLARMPGPLKTIIAALGGFLAIIGPLSLGIGALGIAIKGLGLAIAANPILAALSAVLAIGTAIVASSYDVEKAQQRVIKTQQDLGRLTAQYDGVGVTAAALKRAKVTEDAQKEAVKYLKRRQGILNNINNVEQKIASLRYGLEKTQGFEEDNRARSVESYENAINEATEALDRHKANLKANEDIVDSILGKAYEYQTALDSIPLGPEIPDWINFLQKNGDVKVDLGYGKVDPDFEFEPIGEKWLQDQRFAELMERFDYLSPSELRAISERWTYYLQEAADKIDKIDLSWTDTVEEEPLDEALGFTQEEVEEIQNRIYFLDNVVKQWSDRFLQAIQGIGTAFSNFIFDVANGTKTLAESFRDNLISAIDAVIRKLVALIITFGILKLLAGGTGLLGNLAKGVLGSTGGNLQGFLFNGFGFNNFAGPNGNVGINNRSLNFGGAVSGNQLVFATQRGVNANYRIYG